MPKMTEKQELRVICDNIGNPKILPDFKPLSDKIDDLYSNHRYRINTLHIICDKIESINYHSVKDRGDIKLMLIITYLINARIALKIMTEFVNSDYSPTDSIKLNSKKLGISIKDKENEKEFNDEESFDFDGVTLG